ncbi:helix-turn-helix domain-containing protein [Kordiimonas sp.]|uniref:helix-turn-helix domain-containing protein n=1 Tax=Kordiimonas sp. TaxID=1970157 RepID=UPI003A915678
MSTKIPVMPFINHELDGSKLVSDLCRVPDNAALQTAEFFEDAARKLRERDALWKRQQAIERQTKNHHASITRLPGRVMDQMLNGHSFETAARLVADSHNIPRETVYKYWLDTVASIEATAKQRRDARVWTLYREGMTDAEIADYVGLSDRQVRRIIYRQKNGQ